MEIRDNIELKALTIEHASEIFRILDSEREYMRIWLPFVDTTLAVEDSINAVKMLIGGIDKQFSIFYKTSSLVLLVSRIQI